MRKRIHLFEFEDQTWLPIFLRRSITEFLAAVSRSTQLWKPTAEVLNHLLQSLPEKRLIVLGAGSGGGIMDILPSLPPDVSILLTDLFPDKNFSSPDPRVTYSPESVDAADLPHSLKGVRVLYASFHHLDEEVAKRVLKNAMEAGQPIAIFEGTERSVKGLLATLFIPLLVLIMTPLVRPFRWSRLLFTYLLPVLPLIIFWDGWVSSLRTYSLQEMANLTSDLPEFSWRMEVLKGPHGENIPSLVGSPRK